MAIDGKQALGVFLDAWLSEFKQSVEMFTGQSISMERISDKESGAKANSAEFQWLGQTLELDQSGVVWVGTPLETCTALMKELAADAAGAQSIYAELVEQSFDTAIQALNLEDREKLVRGPIVKNTGGPPEVAAMETIALAIPSQDRTSILVGIDAAAASLLLTEKPSPAKTQTENPKPDYHVSQPLDHLKDIELPVAVVLGRTKLRIRDALKLTAGSLIELDRRVGEPVEIVVHNVVVARGEVVSVKGNYGVKIREVSSRGERYALQASASVHSSLAQLQAAVSSGSVPVSVGAI